MVNTGVVRKIDDLGRVVVPREIWKTAGLNVKDGIPVEFIIDGDTIVLQRYECGCVFCGTVSETNFKLGEKEVCKSCARKLKDTVLE